LLKESTADRRQARTLRGLLGSCHPAPTAAVTIISAALAAGVGLGPGPVALTAAAVLCGQLSVGWSNDRIDAARDAAADRADKPAAAGAVPLPVLATAAVTALLVGIGLSLGLGWRSALAAQVLTAAGWAYNLGLKSTWLSGPAYLIGFGALPAVPYLALPGHPAPPWWAPVAGALLGLGAHCANVLPDLRADLAAGVRGLPHRIGGRATLVLLALALSAASVVVVLGPGRAGPVEWVAGAVAVVLGVGCAGVGLRRPDSAAAFRGALVVALLDVVLFVLATRPG
jgi:4-hydroxybenzoate polyprenyltransferase